MSQHIDPAVKQSSIEPLQTFTLTPAENFTWNANACKVSDTTLYFAGYFGIITNNITTPTVVATMPQEYAPRQSVVTTQMVSNGNTPTGIAVFTITEAGEIKVSWTTGTGNMVLRVAIPR